MDIGALTTTPPPGTKTADPKQKTSVDYESFLRLLVAQLKNQDPTQPMDSTQYVAQLATFSQVEQSVQMNTKLDQMLQGSSLSQADALIGRQITSADGKTTGIVSEVRLTDSGTIAVLKDGGGEVTVENGISVSDPA